MSPGPFDDIAVACPVVIPLATASVSVLAGPGQRRQQAVGLIGCALHLASAIWLLTLAAERGILVSHLGGWEAPVGIALAADRLSAVMVVLASLVAALCALFAVPTLPRPRHATPFNRLLHLMLAGLSGLFLAGDIFNFYVWFELALVCSFGLMVISGRRGAIEGAVKYFAINIVGSMLLLAAIGLLYALTGTLNMAALAVRVEQIERPSLVAAIGGLTIVALGIKGAAFPLFFWLPASYHTPPLAVTALFGGLLTKVGVYGLIRLFTLIFTTDVGYTHTVILVLGGLTMVTGVLGAIAQDDLRRLLSFHIISQIGYMLVSLGLNSALGIAAALIFMVHIVITKTALFFAAGLIGRAGGSFRLHRLGGLYAARPALAVLFLVAALSLGGMPPLSGFIAKLAVIQAALDSGRYLIAALALGVGLLTLYSMAKIWTMAFWSPPPRERTGPERRLPALMWCPPVILASLTVAIGVAAEPVLEYAARAAESLVDRSAYIHAVLGAAPGEDRP